MYILLFITTCMVISQVNKQRKVNTVLHKNGEQYHFVDCSC